MNHDYSHEFTRLLFFVGKAMTNLDSVLKGRNIILLTKIRIVKAMVFPVVMYGCESWTIKMTGRINTFELWYWRKLESDLDSKEFKPVNPEGNQP